MRAVCLPGAVTHFAFTAVVPGETAEAVSVVVAFVDGVLFECDLPPHAPNVTADAIAERDERAWVCVRTDGYHEYITGSGATTP